MKKLLILAAACAAVLASLVPSATAITGNYQKDFVHDYVGLLVFYDFDDPDGDGTSSSSGAPARCSPTGYGRDGWALRRGPGRRPHLLGAVRRAELRPGRLRGLGGDPTTGYPYFDYGPADTSTFSRADNYGFTLRRLPEHEGRRRRHPRPAAHDAVRQLRRAPDRRRDRPLRRAVQVEAGRAVRLERLRPLRSGPAPGLVPRAADGQRHTWSTTRHRSRSTT